MDEFSENFQTASDPPPPPSPLPRPRFGKLCCVFFREIITLSRKFMTKLPFPHERVGVGACSDILVNSYLGGEIVRDCAVKDEKICKMHLQQTRSMPDLMSDGKKLKLEME